MTVSAAPFSLHRSLKELESLSVQLSTLVAQGEWDAAAALAPRIGQSFATVQKGFETSFFVSSAERAACAQTLRSILINYREAETRLAPWLSDVKQLLADMSGSGG